jgi:hypothetical protein
MRCLPAALALLLLAGAAPAAAQSELPAGRFGGAVGVRQNGGALGNSYGLGGVFGIEAGYQPNRAGRTHDLGVSWAVLWGFFPSDDPELVKEWLRVLEMSFGLRFRRSLAQSTPRFLVASAGLSLYRTNVPVPPDDNRLYLGPYAGIGVDQYVANRYLANLEARYGLLGGGPGSLSLGLSFAVGSR